jgi:hypothetical protein
MSDPQHSRSMAQGGDLSKISRHCPLHENVFLLEVLVPGVSEARLHLVLAPQVVQGGLRYVHPPDTHKIFIPHC